MMKSQIEVVKLSSIEQPILDCMVVSKADVKRMAESDGHLPLVSLAQIGRKLYPIGGFAILSAAVIRSDESIKAIITSYGTKKDAVRASLSSNSVMEPINVLKTNEICSFLGEDASTVVSKCSLGGTFFEKIVNAHINSDVYAKCEEVINRLSEKLPAQTLAIPPYILMDLAKVDPKKQLAVFDIIYEQIEFERSESQFTWPTPAQVIMAVRVTGVVEEEEGVIVHPASFGDGIDIDSGVGTDADIDDGDEQSMETKASPETLQLAKQSKNCIIIPTPSGDYKVDKKTNTVEQVAATPDKRNFKSLFVPSERAVIMAPSIVKHLGLADTPASENKFDNTADAIKYLRTIGKKAKIAIFWTA